MSLRCARCSTAALRGVDARNADGATALVAAAYGNHLEAARLLIDAGADVNLKDSSEQSAYLIATSEVGDDPRLLELTLAHGAEGCSSDSARTAEPVQGERHDRPLL